MSKTTLRYAFLSLPLLVGCATSDPAGTVPDATPAKKFDTAGFDTPGKDTNETEDTSVVDTGPSCVPLTSEQRPCGKCGKQTRVCTPAGIWGEFSVCTGELSFTSCSVGEVQTTPCGNCGKQTDTCDPMTCEWVTGSCAGEGVCADGETEESSASCTVVGEVRTRTCSSSCMWGPFSDCSLPKGWVSMASAPSGFEARGGHTAVWTGTDMIVWGGYSSTYTSPTYCRRNGASYNLAGNSWKTISLPPSTFTARYAHTAVWTGSKMVIWGGNDYSAGYRNDGAIYDPPTDTWTLTGGSAPSARYGHGAVWSTTTNEMLVWGGYGSSCSGSYCADGAAYNPSTNTWTAIPAAPIAGRWNHVAVWTGTELVIWGGQGATGFLRDGARYDPNTKVWTKFPDPPVELDGRYEASAVWSGKEVLAWGGYGTYVSPTYGRSDGGRYTPGGSWTRFTAATDAFGSGSVLTRFASQAWSAGGKLFIWSGGNGSSSTGTAVAGGASYDPALDKWTTLPTTGEPTARVRASVVWTGKEAIIWGGAGRASLSYSAGYYADGAIFRP